MARNRERMAAVVLAAGSGQRMGEPKALLRYGHDTGLERALRCLAKAGVESLIVVLGAEADRVLSAHEEALTQPGVVVEIHRAWDQGRTSSLKAGWSRLHPDATGVVLHTVDHPLVLASTVTSLIDSWASGGSQIVVPGQAGRRGHPIVMDRSLQTEVLALEADEPLRKVVGRNADRVVEIEVNDPGVLLNVNTPEDHARALEALQKRSWDGVDPPS